MAGDYELDQGVVRFETGAGAVVTIAAPAAFTIAAADRIEMTSGRLAARMLRDESRLAVKAGGVEVRDLGTAFGLDASDAGRMLLSVFDGEVAVTNSGVGGDGLRLVEGQSLVGGRGVSEGIELAAYAPESFAAITTSPGRRPRQARTTAGIGMTVFTSGGRAT